MHIRPCDIQDLPAITAIYGREVEEGTASFETEPPDLAEITRRYQAIREHGLPYLVADRDGHIAGYAYAGPYHTRYGYRMTVENSIYIARDAQGQGVGTALLASVIEAATNAGMRQMIAIIGESTNQASIRLHAKAGFRQVGTLENVGRKFGKFLDVVIMQRSLEGHATIGE